MEQDTLTTLEFDLTEAIKDLIFHIRQNNSEIKQIKQNLDNAKQNQN